MRRRTGNDNTEITVTEVFWFCKAHLAQATFSAWRSEHAYLGHTSTSELACDAETSSSGWERGVRAGTPRETASRKTVKTQLQIDYGGDYLLITTDYYAPMERSQGA